MYQDLDDLIDVIVVFENHRLRPVRFRWKGHIHKIARVTPERVIREGDTAQELIKLIDEDTDIGILVLAAGTGKDGPGPLVSGLAKTAGEFPIPVAIVPGNLSDAELDAMA